MKYRKKLSKHKSKKLFTKTANRTLAKNVQTTVMRGGIRL